MEKTEKSHSFRTSGTNLRKAKTHNHSVVLEVIRTQGPISRTKISQVTSLSRQTIQNIVAQLEELDLIQMTASKIVGRGHPGMEVSLNKDAALSFGIHVDRTRATAVVCNLDGQATWETTRDLSSATPEAANTAIAAIVSTFRKAHGDLFPTVVGCGIAAAGPFGSQTVPNGDPTSFHELGTQENLALLERQLGLPIALENDAAAAAVGEGFYGAGRGVENFAFLQFGVGLGAGFVLKGDPYTGSHGNAGELGHVIVELDGEPCPCGNSGCLERYLSIDALCRHLGLPRDDRSTFNTISELIDAKDEKIIAWIKNAIPRLHQAVNILELMLDPETIIIGGTTPESFLKLLIQMATPFPAALSKREDGKRIQNGAAGNFSVALGASAVSMNTHFAPSVSRLVL
ncbi:sugar kinase [Sedimentitalea sp. CY04]|uniref:Sugar kinase n=1 Tax=Parasedimentitalea denitrificans TaxID=2211118 RepID=A0ABX0WF40_9RHOB|nr:ROK family transcriptional regulator [Sedimentitalea sp. CY04]NIZ63409.1 sugar kinase [Sedimentitalea sp. CY04]